MKTGEHGLGFELCLYLLPGMWYGRYNLTFQSLSFIIFKEVIIIALSED